MTGSLPPRVSIPRKASLRFVFIWLFCTACGIAVAAGGALLAARIMEGRTTGIGDLVAVLVSMLVGFPLGVCLGLALLRLVARWPGSLVWGSLGAILGAAFVILAAEPLRLNAETELLLVTYALCITVFATAGFTWRPRGDHADPSSRRTGTTTGTG